MTVEDIIDRYCEAWNERDAERRAALLENAWSDDGVYCDPTAHVIGRAALVEHIGGVFDTFGSYRMWRSSGLDEHHGHVRFAWTMQTEGEDVIADGIDVVRLAPDGRIGSIIGFFGPVPEGGRAPS